jgi:ubiquinone/menaquinone biosynthesis C-methylase UbiE
MINDILEFLNEDKHSNLTTTSNKFKRDIWNFFDGEDWSDKVCLELGTHKGQTTYMLSHIFGKVITVNRSEESLIRAREINSGRDNIEFVAFDLYATPFDKKITDDVIDVLFIDAGHSYNEVMMDVTRILNHHNYSDDLIIIFDDFGLIKSVNDAITELLMNNKIEFVTEIGEPINHNFGGVPERILRLGSEGVICRAVK